jgi:hypothetical protein
LAHLLASLLFLLVHYWDCISFGSIIHNLNVVRPKPYGNFITRAERGISSLAYACTISSAVMFGLLWIGTVFCYRAIVKDWVDIIIIGMNPRNSLDGKAPISGEAGLENFAITIPDSSSFNTIKSVIISDSVTFEY